MYHNKAAKHLNTVNNIFDDKYTKNFQIIVTFVIN